MGKYLIALSPSAKKELQIVYKSGDKGAIKKIEQLVKAIAESPNTGIGKPELLKGVGGIWSRRIDKKNRILYTVKEERKIVLVLSVLGHYNDK